MNEKNIRFERNPDAAALEIATKEIRKYKRREKRYRIAAALLAAALVIVCIGFLALCDDVHPLHTEGDVQQCFVASAQPAVSVPAVNLLLRERTKKRGVF